MNTKPTIEEAGKMIEKLGFILSTRQDLILALRATLDNRYQRNGKYRRMSQEYARQLLDKIEKG